MLKCTPCDGSRHASCINWLTYNVEGHLPQNTSMSHTPTTNRRLAVFTTLELTCKRIQATVHADKQTNAHTHKLEWIYVVTKISVIHGKCSGCIDKYTSAATYIWKVRSNSRKWQIAYTDIKTLSHRGGLQPVRKMNTVTVNPQMQTGDTQMKPALNHHT